MARLLSDFREWGLLLMLVLLPLPFGAVEPWARSAYMFMVILLAASWALEMNATDRWKWHRTPLDIPFGLMLVWSVITTFTSSDRYDSFQETALYTTHILLYWVVVHTVRRREDVRRLALVLIGAGAMLSGFGLVQYTGALPRDWWYVPVFLSATYVNHNHFAGYLELLIPVALGVRLYARRRWERSLMGYALVIMAMAFVLTLSRGGWLSLAVALAGLLWLVRAPTEDIDGDADDGHEQRPPRIRRWRIVSVGVVGALAALTLAAEPILERMGTFADVGTESIAYSARPEIYRATLKLIGDHPLLGSGPGAFVHAFQQYRPATVAYRIHYAHNDYLQLAAELGVIGLVLFLVIGGILIVSGLRHVRATESRFRRYALAGFLAGLVSLAVHSVVDFNLHIPANAALASVWAGILMGYGRRR